MKTSHLSIIQNATCVTWHSSQDYQAVRMWNGEMRLYIKGEHILLTAKNHGPVQTVINGCMQGLSANRLAVMLGCKT